MNLRAHFAGVPGALLMTLHGSRLFGVEPPDSDWDAKTVLARMACGAMSHNDIQFLDAARANGDTEHRFMWKGAPAEVERLRESVVLWPAWKVKELMQARRTT